MCNVQYYADELGCNRQVLHARGRKAHSPHYNAMLYTLELGGLTLFKQGSVCHLSTSNGGPPCPKDLSVNLKTSFINLKSDKG